MPKKGKKDKDKAKKAKKAAAPAAAKPDSQTLPPSDDKLFQEINVLTPALTRASESVFMRTYSFACVYMCIRVFVCACRVSSCLYMNLHKPH